jgi:hypothetical protein
MLGLLLTRGLYFYMGLYKYYDSQQQGQHTKRAVRKLEPYTAALSVVAPGHLSAFRSPLDAVSGPPFMAMMAGRGQWGGCALE